MKIQELREKRNKAIGDAKAVMATVEAENRDMSAEEAQKFDALMADAEKAKEQITRLESLDAVEQEQQNSRGRIVRGEVRRTNDENTALRNWLMAGIPGSGATAERSLTFSLGAKALRVGQQYESRAQSTATGAAGGFTVPDDTMRELEQALLAFGGVRQAASVIRTASGADLPWPLSDNTDQVATILGQNQAATDGDLEFGQATLKAHKYVTPIIKVPVELIQDSAIDIAAYVGARLGEMVGRGTNRHFTTGTGTTQPQGIINGATLGKTAASQTAVTYEELVDFLHSVDPAYRSNFTWMFHDDTLRELRKLRDNDGKLIWQESMRTGEPDRILGKPYIINQDMPTMAASAKAIIGGDLGKYKVRDVRDVSVVRLDERFAEYLQVAFLAYSRHDGLLLDAGTHPVKYLQMAA